MGLLHTLYIIRVSCFVGFAEKLFHQLESTTERFEVKVMMVDLISRLVGIHQVMVTSIFQAILNM